MQKSVLGLWLGIALKASLGLRLCPTLQHGIYQPGFAWSYADCMGRSRLPPYVAAEPGAITAPEARESTPPCRISSPTCTAVISRQQEFLKGEMRGL